MPEVRHARFIQQIRKLPSLGLLDIEEQHKRSGTTITIGRVVAEQTEEEED
jgi:hypothetical protein